MVYRASLSTPQAAEVCRVSQKTVLHWIHGGALRASRSSGGHYRIWPADLKSFIDASGMDIHFEFVDSRLSRAVVVDPEPSFTHMLESQISHIPPGVSVRTATTAREGLVLIGEFQPHVALLDLEPEDIPGNELIPVIRRRLTRQEMSIVGLSRCFDPLKRGQFMNLGVDCVLNREAPPELMISAIRFLLKIRTERFDPGSGGCRVPASTPSPPAVGKSPESTGPERRNEL